jgi:hypothetical protein
MTIINATTETTTAWVLVRRIRSWPFVRIEQRGDRVAIRGGVRDTSLARLDLGSSTLTIFVVADLLPALVATEPLLRRTDDGVRLALSDATSLDTGERLLRWRVDLERFGPQLREASP